jgi:hypothetical protein
MRKLLTTASNDPSSNGSAPASASTNETAGCSDAASETISAEKSTPTTAAPRAAARPAAYPGPVATSRTDEPSPIPAASSSAGTGRAVIAPRPW